MTELDAVRKYEEAWTCHNYHYGWLVEKDKADAAIAALQDRCETIARYDADRGEA